MTKQIDQLMALADKYAIAIATQGEAHDHVARDALRQALEAALKPGEPVHWPAGAAQMHTNLLGIGKAMAKERSREIGDAWNQLADLLALLAKARLTAPPAQTPPPRLTETDLINLFGGYGGIETAQMINFRKVETAVRKQLLGRDK